MVMLPPTTNNKEKWYDKIFINQRSVRKAWHGDQSDKSTDKASIVSKDHHRKEENTDPRIRIRKMDHKQSQKAILTLSC